MANPFDAIMKMFEDLYDNLTCARKSEKDHNNAEPIATTRAPIGAAPPPTPGPVVAAADAPLSPLLPENVTVPVISRAASDLPSKGVASAIQQGPIADDYYAGNSLYEDFGRSAPLGFVAATASAPTAPFATASVTAAAPPTAGLPVPGGLPPPPSPAGPTVLTPPSPAGPTVLTPASALGNALGVPIAQTTRVSKEGEESAYGGYYDYEYHYYSYTYDSEPGGEATGRDRSSRARTYQEVTGEAYPGPMSRTSMSPTTGVHSRVPAPVSTGSSTSSLRAARDTSALAAGPAGSIVAHTAAGRGVTRPPPSSRVSNEEQASKRREKVRRGQPASPASSCEGAHGTGYRVQGAVASAYEGEQHPSQWGTIRAPSWSAVTAGFPVPTYPA